MSDRPRVHKCFGCGNETTLHFSLMLYAPHPSRSRRAAGTIDLCQLCWRDACRASAIRRRPRRTLTGRAEAHHSALPEGVAA